jgi:uncharacterized damage-inducible protein DinB
MTDHQHPDPTTDRALRHMAWANQQLIARLAEQPDVAQALALTAPRNEWSAGRILAHLANAANGYGARLQGLPRQPQLEPATSSADLATIADRLAASDARLREQAARPEGMAAYAGDSSSYPRSTVIAQAIHHATEHRAQIAGALATNGNNAIDLDAIDLWGFTDAEGAGA